MNIDMDNENKRGIKNPLKEGQLIKEIQNILHEQYGYSRIQFEYKAPGTDSERNADLVVFDENKSPIIVVEVKNSTFVLPLAEYKLKEILIELKAHFGLIYNGTEKLAYERIGDSLVRIKDIPKQNVLMKSLQKLKSKPHALPENEIWKIADYIRRDFYNYDVFLQVLALKILDEQTLEGKLFEKVLTNTLRNEDINRLLTIGRQNFPTLFASSEDFYGRYQDQLIHLFYTIGHFSLQESNVQTITKAILFFSNTGNVYFPEELSYFILNLLSIQLNKKILIPYGAQGYYFHIGKFLAKYFKLRKQTFSKYLENHLAITESNMKRLEVFKIICLLRKEPFRLIEHEFLKLEQKSLDDFDYIFCIPPIDARVHSIEIDRIFGKDYGKDYGNQLINYVFLKLHKNEKLHSRAAILVPLGFLSSRYSDSIRRLILNSGKLRAIIHLPRGIFKPLTNIQTALIIIDFHAPNTRTTMGERIFLSQIPETKLEGRKFESAALKVIHANFKRFERGEKFKESSLNFVLQHSMLEDSWTVFDKTPEMRKIFNMPSSVKLSELGQIFYGRAGDVETELDRKHIQIPYLRISDIKDGLINYPVQKSVTVRNEGKYSDFLIQEGDVILSCQGTIGKVALARKKDVGILPSPQVAVIRPYKNKILPEFLIQALNSEGVQYQLRIKSVGDFIRRLNKDQLVNIILPAPPLSEQNSSVAAFRKEKERIESLERELDLAKKKLLKTTFGD